MGEGLEEAVVSLTAGLSREGEAGAEVLGRQEKSRETGGEIRSGCH